LDARAVPLVPEHFPAEALTAIHDENIDENVACRLPFSFQSTYLQRLKGTHALLGNHPRVVCV
jgi:hypothetical protein